LIAPIRWTRLSATDVGRAGLETLGLWQSIADKIAIAESPPAALALVTRGEAPVTLVFSTNAVGVPGIKIAGVLPRDSHLPIVFPAALLRDSHNADAPTLCAFGRWIEESIHNPTLVRNLLNVLLMTDHEFGSVSCAGQDFPGVT
jgi:hypothetical protein